MKELIVKSILTTSLFLLIILAFVYNFIFNPLYQSLEETLLENFTNIAETSKTSFDYILARGIENSKSISSRTMIKEKILEYNQDTINLEELKSYTRPRYLEGIQALENIVYSSRKVDNIIIASSGSKPDNISTIESVEKIKYEFFKERDKINLIVYSPILEGKGEALDTIIFDISNYLPKLELDSMSIDVVDDKEAENFSYINTRNPLVSESKEIDGQIYLSVFYEIKDAKFLKVSIPKDIYYKEFNRITQRSANNLIKVFIFSFFSINIIIAIFANNKIISLDQSSKKYKRDSHYDTLTGAHSRKYLQEWLKDNQNKNIKNAIVFIDMNNFKDINDQYGHIKGDEVLVEIVSIIKKEIRDDDFVIRYGGDEFIILLKNVSNDIAEKVIKRISINLESIELADIKISFSYGIGQLENTNNFNKLLEKLDKRMYEMKVN